LLEILDLELRTGADDGLTNSPKKRSLSWWRLGFGGFLLLAGLKNFDHRNVPQELMPSNDAQWFGFFLATGIILVTGLFFLITGVRRISHRPPK